MRFLGIGFLIFIFLEIMSIVWVASWIGGIWTLAVMIISFIIGISMLRHFGISGLLLAGASIHSGNHISPYQMLWPIRYAISALLFMSPGFISLIFALILLLPFKGKNFIGAETFSFTNNQYNPFQSKPDHDDDIIEGEYTVEPNKTSSKPSQYIDHH